MIHHGDLFDVLPTLPAESLDACVTDPPYGIGFMGKAWDNFSPTATERRIVPNRAIASDNPNLKGRTRGPASSPSAVEYNRSLEGQRGFQTWTMRWAAEVFRVLKPGAYVLVCGAPRSFHRMTCGLEDAGFEIRDCLSWLYGQGFPKSLNIGDGQGTALKPGWEPIVLAWKPFKWSIKACHAQHGTAALNIDATRIRPTSQDGSRSSYERSNGRTALWLEASRICHSASSRPEAWSDAELAPLASLLASALARGLQNESPQGSQAGCLPCPDCDGGRVRFVAAVGQAFAQPRADVRESLDLQWIGSRIRGCRCGVHPSIWDALALQVSSGNYTISDVENDLGRWPANVILDPGAAAQLDEQTGEWRSARQGNGGDWQPAKIDIGTIGLTQHGASANYDDLGGASRFYYVAKPSREERDYGCEDLPTRSGGEACEDRAEGSAGLNNPRAGAGRTGGARNIHPTVKPVELMRWLVKLVTPLNGTVLDPFTGSGTTGMACRYEQRGFIGIERESEYVAIAERRIGAVCPLFAEGDGMVETPA